MPEDKREKERFKVFKQLMAHLVGGQGHVASAWKTGNQQSLQAQGVQSQQRLSDNTVLMNTMTTGQTTVAQQWVAGNQTQTQASVAQTQASVASATTAAQQKSTGLQSWASNFLLGQQQVQALGAQMGNDIANSFQTFTTEAQKGQLNLAQAATYLGKEILKDVLDAVASTLMSKGEIQLALGAALLAGIFTAALAAPHLIAAGMFMGAGMGIQMAAAALLAEGALVVKPTLAVVGEGGQPEAVIPANRFAEFGLTGGLQVGTVRMTFPDMTSLSDASNPAFSTAVSQELQAAYQAANQGKNK